MCFTPQQCALFRHLDVKKWSEHVVLLPFWLGNVLRATTACTFSTSQLPKVVRTCGAFTILTWKCASRHKGVHFFDISISKSGPNMWCFYHFDLEMCFAPQWRALFRHLNFQKWSEASVWFVHFDLEMCFAPQRRALFRHLNFQKWSEHVVFLPFWLGNVLRTTTGCTFSTTQLLKSGLRMWVFDTFDLETCFAPQRHALFRHLNFQKWSEAGVFCMYILTWKCASRHNGVHFFDISTSKNGPKLVCGFYILTWKFASHHNGVHFFDISTSKSGPNMWCFYHFDLEMCFAPQGRALFRHLNFQKWSESSVWFVHFDLEMCFAPQRRALFRHLNFQKWSEHVALLPFWLGNVLRATTACTFSTSQLPKVVRSWCVLYVHFDLEMCFAPQQRALFRHLNFQKWSESSVWFVHFDLEMCFAPQRRALFRHLNFQKWSEHVVLLPFWLGNVLRATRACTLSTTQLPKVV